jgi:hypothetical protein
MVSVIPPEQDVNVGLVAATYFITPPHDILGCSLEILIRAISLL